eukprot:m51a1_g3519 hypothetical protein (511) ;mRNA; r:912243-914548
MGDPKPVQARRAAGPPVVARETVLKIVVVGAPEVGKSSIVWQYVHSCHSCAYYPTVGVEMMSVARADPRHPLCAANGGTPVRVNFWDVPYPEVKGQHARQVLHRADAVLTVFNGFSTRTVDAVDEWRIALQKTTAGRAMPPVALLSHKSDLRRSLISAQDLDSYCENTGCAFWRSTSVTEPDTLNDAVDYLLALALRAHNEEEARRALRKQEAAERAARERCVDDMRRRGHEEPQGKEAQELLEKKVLDLQVDVEDFYGRRLQSDLAKLRDIAGDAPIARNIEVFEEQRSEEYRKFLSAINKTQQDGGSSSVSHRLRHVERAQMALLEKINKWKMLIAQLSAEIGINMQDASAAPAANTLLKVSAPPSSAPVSSTSLDGSSVSPRTFSSQVGILSMPLTPGSSVGAGLSMGSSFGAAGGTGSRKMGFLFRSRRTGLCGYSGVGDYSEDPSPMGSYSVSSDLSAMGSPSSECVTPPYSPPSRLTTPGNGDDSQAASLDHSISPSDLVPAEY